MNVRKPIIAAIVAALLLAAFLLDRNFVRRENIETAKSLRIMDFDFMDATMVVLQNESGEYRLEKRNGDEWWLTKPAEMRAEASQVQALVDNVRGAKKSLPFKAEDLSEYGLDDPLPVVTIEAHVAGKPEKVTLLFGAEASQLGRVYAMVRGTEEVFTLGDWVRNHAQKDMQILRDKSLLEFDPIDVQTVSIRGAQPAFTLRRDAAGDFPWLLADKGTPANSEMVDRALRTIGSARAVKMLDNPTSPALDMGFVPPMLTIDFTTATTGPITLEIGKKVPGEELFFARSNVNETPGILRAATIADFLRPRIEWSTRKLVWMKARDMQRLETRSGQAEMSLSRGEDGEWHFEEFPDIAINPEKLRSFLDAVTSFSADRPIAGEAQRAHGFDSPSLELVAWNAAGQSQGMRVGAVDTSEGIAYARRVQDDTIWGVDFQRVNVLYRFRRDLEERRIQTGFADATRKVEILTSGNTVTIERKKDVWQLTFPGEAVRVVENDKVAVFLDRAQSLEWENELVSGAAPEADLKVRFIDGEGEELYAFELLVNADGDRLVRAGGRTYFVEPRQVSQLDKAMVALMQRVAE